jgi:hypothetical protein
MMPSRRRPGVLELCWASASASAAVVADVQVHENSDRRPCVLRGGCQSVGGERRINADSNRFAACQLRQFRAASGVHRRIRHQNVVRRLGHHAGFAGFGDGQSNSAMLHLELAELNRFMRFGVRAQAKSMAACVVCEALDIAADNRSIKHDARRR